MVWVKLSPERIWQLAVSKTSKESKIFFWFLNSINKVRALLVLQMTWLIHFWFQLDVFASTDPPYLLSINSKSMNLGRLSQMNFFFILLSVPLCLYKLISTVAFLLTLSFLPLQTGCLDFGSINKSVNFFFSLSDVLALHSFLKTILNMLSVFLF